MHKIGDRKSRLHAGDIVTIPQGMAHNARNIGTEDGCSMSPFHRPIGLPSVSSPLATKACSSRGSGRPVDTKSDELSDCAGR